MKEAVIVSGARTAVGRAPKGTLRASRPDDMAAAAISEAIDRAGALEKRGVGMPQRVTRRTDLTEAREIAHRGRRL